MTFQNASFISGTSSTTAMTQSGTITASRLYDPSFLDRKYEYNRTKEAYEIENMGQDNLIDTDLNNVIAYIELGKEDQALEAYNQLLEDMQSQTRYSRMDEDTLKATARALLDRAAVAEMEGTGNEVDNVGQLIRMYTRDEKSVETQQLLWGSDNCDSTSTEDLLSEICNIDQEEAHLNILQKGFYGFIGIFSKIGNAVFGDGTKH